jgi:hypothetical protein
MSALDVLVLIVGTLGTIALGSVTWWWGFIVGFVLAHFFLFCNVVRMARPMEIAWSLVFVILAGGTIAAEFPGWPMTAVGASMATAMLVTIEVRKPSYHGAGWEWMNPGLRAWWEDQAMGNAKEVQ